jgi:heme/copper-type cytochrome/quinol oxidase subunit 1
VITVAWVSVIANVVVWAHHVIDYPTDLQKFVSTAMQPTTFALTIPSALSLYSLFFTVYRSRFRTERLGPVPGHGRLRSASAW